MSALTPVTTLPANGVTAGTFQTTSRFGRVAIANPAGNPTLQCRIIAMRESGDWAETGVGMKVGGGVTGAVIDFPVADIGAFHSLYLEGAPSIPAGFTAFMKSLPDPTGIAGIMDLTSPQTVAGAKTFNDGDLLANNASGTFASTLRSKASAARNVNLPDEGGSPILATYDRLAAAGSGATLISVLDTALVAGGSNVETAIASLGKRANTERQITINVLLKNAASGNTVYRCLPGYAGTISRLELSVNDPPTTVAKVATFQTAISGTATTGGALATTTTGLGTVGVRQASSTITAANAFTATQEIEITVPSAAATYVEGQAILELFLIPAA